jgi:leader peptidase (prepilin peptidase)/N-methyltransferase
MFIISILVFLFGLLVGSFLNVCIYRYNTGLSIYTGRSKCFICGKELRWFELIPVFSFLAQKGKCRKCFARISWQYPLVEILTAVLFLIVFFRQYYLYPKIILLDNGLYYLVGLFFFYIVIMSILVVLTVYDLKHKIIPDGLVYTFIFLSTFKLLFFIFIVTGEPTLYLKDLLSPFILFSFFWILWFISKGSWVGFADAKMAFGMGAMLGLVAGVSSVMIGFWVGALFSIFILLFSKFSSGRFNKMINMKTEIPFAPFLLIGLIIVFLTRVDVLSLSNLL